MPKPGATLLLAFVLAAPLDARAVDFEGKVDFGGRDAFGLA